MPLCGTGRHGFAVQNVPPHFLFVLPKRKRAGHGTKEKTLRGDLTRRCQITQNGGLAVTNCRPNPEVSYRLRYTYSTQNCVPAPESPPHTNVPNRTPPALLSAAAPPSNSGRGFQRRGVSPPSPVPGRGFPKGEGRSPRPLCRWGSRAKSKRPGAFLPGCGAGSFPEKNAPHVPAVETVPCGSRELCESARHRRALPCYPKS